MAVASGDGTIVLTTRVDQTGLKQGMSSMKSSASSVAGAFGKMGVAIGAALSIKALISFSNEASKMASNTEASVQRLIDIYGSASQAVGDFIDANANALGMSRAAAAQFASVYGNLFSVWADQATNAQLTTKYLNMTAVVASKTGRTMEDVQERIRSGLLGNTEAVEDLGIFVNVKTIEMTEAFNRIANGRSWNQLNSYEQSQVRTLAILEQATNKYGNTVAQNTSFVRAQYNAAFEDFKNTWGTVVNYILMPVLKALTKVLQYATAGLQVIAQMSGKTIDVDVSSLSEQEKTINGAVDGQNDLTTAVKKTAKEQKKSLATFDTIQKLTEESAEQQTPEAGGGGAPPVEIPSAGGASAPDVSQVETATTKVSTALDTAKTKAGEVGKSLSENFKPSVEAVEAELPGIVTKAQETAVTVGTATQTVYEESIAPLAGRVVNEFIPDITNATTTNLMPIAGDIATVGMDTFAETYEWGTGKIEEINKDIVEPSMETLTTITTDTVDGLGAAWDEYGEGIVEQTETADDSARTLWDSLYQKVIEPIFGPFIEDIQKVWDEHLKPLWDNITLFWGSITEFALTFWNNVLAPFIDFVITMFAPLFVNAFNGIKDVVNTVIGVVSDVLSGVMTAARGLLDFLTGVFQGDWEKAWEGLKTFVSGIWDAIWGIIKGVINLIIDGLNGLWRGVYSVFSGIANGIGKAVGWIGDLLGKDWGFSMPQEPPLIPKLARGAVIPPNREFLAVLGDQRSGTNIETPLDTMVEAFQRALDTRGGTEVTVNFTGTEARLIRYLSPKISQSNKYRGKNLITGGQI